MRLLHYCETSHEHASFSMLLLSQVILKLFCLKIWNISSYAFLLSGVGKWYQEKGALGMFDLMMKSPNPLH